MPKFVTSGDRIVGSRVRLLRKQCAVGERDLAQLLGVSAREIHAYESGEARIGAEGLSKISQALGAPIAYFFTGLSVVVPRAANAPPGQELMLLTPGAVELLSAYSRLASPQLRDAALKLVLHLAHGNRGSVALAPAKGHATKHRSSSQAR